MSDVASAAAALGIPESLVERSVEARASASGANVADLLTQWAGGETAPIPEPAADATAAELPGAPVEETAAPEPVPEIVVAAREPVASPEPVPAGPYGPPVLVGVKDSPMSVLAGAIGLFLMVVLVGLIGPSIPTETVGARTSEVAYSAAALDGQEIYGTAGCGSCHTQMVRPIVADVGLGAVTLGDTNQVLGTRRFGPDLSDIGTRMAATQIEATIGGIGGHPRQVLDPHDLNALVTYLSESKTSLGEEGES